MSCLQEFFKVYLFYLKSKLGGFRLINSLRFLLLRDRIPSLTLLPMLFVLVLTLWALGSLVYGNFKASSGFDIKFVNGMASLTLIALAVYLVVVALLKVRSDKRNKLTTAEG